jgi:ComF family protein
MLETIGRGLLALVVPPLCASCREPELSGAAVCPDCRSRLVALRDPRCARCGAPTAHASSGCHECHGRRAFSRAWSPFAYEGTSRALVNALKSRALVSVADLMGREIARRAPPGLLAGKLVPVPAHARRRRRHGFNHAAAIARATARRLDLPVRDVLVRAGGRPRQVGLERGARLGNVRGSVRPRDGASVPERAVLVDDVYTTGATLHACAEALLEAGAREVVAVTFARAIRE